ncbi:Purine nucleoside permease [Lachnellula hyalina]|uniref:Purine nucleoside permease n=1 Tax=Lachnellula hyalina TaxID=1316788 RepID=A0A8H8TZW2_9HELO|nr:Purine nucleoside permease [Lachnellula hyalina]TVY28257.1 Purine nucleoside permease [Lachnellula hyalina]
MKFTGFMAVFWAAGVCMASPLISTREDNRVLHDRDTTKPQIFIIALFPPERDTWLNSSNTASGFGSHLLEKNITVPGFSPLYPDAHCKHDGSVCLLTTGESEINAAATISALMLSPLFDLRKTYFLISGIAGVNPKQATLNDVAFSKYAVQVALQYEIDARELPSGYGFGYIPQGSHFPDDYPSSIYGTEVFELNEALRDMAVKLASRAKMIDTNVTAAYRKQYAGNQTAASPYAKGLRSPSVIKCDVVTSDVYFSGQLLAEGFENTTRLFTNGSATYCMTAQEDNAILGAMVRGAKAKVMDFARVIVMRAGTNFDRPPPGIDCLDNLFSTSQGAFQSSLYNLFLAGSQVVDGIMKGWGCTFENGVKAENYIGDIFGTLGGTPDFGPGSDFGDNPVQTRAMGGRVVHSESVAGRKDGKGKWGAMVARTANGNA